MQKAICGQSSTQLGKAFKEFQPPRECVSVCVCVCVCVHFSIGSIHLDNPDLYQILSYACVGMRGLSLIGHVH